jgi:cytochrome d ubiquinol oxidase subunit II
VINTIWFVVLAFMLAGYAVLDGFDLGIGTLHLLLGRSTAERARLIDTIGPVWNGNEVWLLAAGGSMVVAFPTLYAASFSGFYLALMIVLWLLLLRGLGIEFRHQIHHPLWEHAWDVAFSIASLLLSLLFGVALGNVLRGVPFDAGGQFRGSFTVLLNPFSILGGLLGVATLAFHGACWAALKCEGDLQIRARQFASVLWFATTALLAAMIAASFVVSPHFTANFARHPALLAMPAGRHSRVGGGGPVSDAAAVAAGQPLPRPRHLQRRGPRRQHADGARRVPPRARARHDLSGEHLSHLARQGRADVLKAAGGFAIRDSDWGFGMRDSG